MAKDRNQATADRLSAWDLPDDVRAIVDDTAINCFDDVFGGIETREELIEYVRTEWEVGDDN